MVGSLKHITSIRLPVICCSRPYQSLLKFSVMASKVPTIKFNNGREVPILGLGTWKSQPGQVTQAVKDAIDIGYRHIDCALVYGNEPEVGLAIKEKIDAGVVKREDLFITSKLWNTFHRPDLVAGAIKKSLTNLGLEYLDLYLIHWPQGYKEDDIMFPEKDGKTIYSDADYVDTWKEMEMCVKQGFAKSIGVSNFNSKQIDRILAMAEIKPVNNQVECHPYLNQSNLMKYCKSKDITITAYSPLGSPDRPWAKPGDAQLMDDSKLKQVAEKYGKSTAQILLRYQAQRGNIVIPKSVTKSRILENFNIFDFTLAAEDMTYIDNFDCNGRLCHLDWIKDHKHYPFNIAF